MEMPIKVSDRQSQFTNFGRLRLLRRNLGTAKAGQCLSLVFKVRNNIEQAEEMQNHPHSVAQAKQLEIASVTSHGKIGLD
jgi:hypothetical protein